MPRNRLVIEGTLGAGDQERFSCGITYGPQGDSLIIDPAGLNEWAETAADYLASLSPGHAVRAPISTVGNIRTIKTYFYASNGPATAVGGASIQGGLPGAAAPTMPFQVARVVTLNTAIAGRRTRGRIYWPHLTGSLSTGGTLTQSQSQADEWAAALEALGLPNVVSPALRPAVYSAVADLVTPVTAISIGNVLDTQRRRTDGLTETRLFATL